MEMERTRVLVVDDEDSLRHAFTRNLEAAGLVVDSAVDGASAAALIGRNAYDVIVSDIAMPGMDGVQLLHRVREHDMDVPVILMTGSPTLDTAIRAVELGALRYLVKPFKNDVLINAVNRAARLHKVAVLKRQALVLTGAAGGQAGDLATLEASFDRALATSWIAFQPVVDLSQRTIYAFEALMRSNEPSLPHPGAVLDAAERLGRLDELGRAVRNHTAALVNAAPAQYVFVNLHPRDLLDDDLYASSAPLSKMASRIVLEITERAALEEVSQVTARISSLRAMGFRVAIDDLGAGYAGLTSFAQLEPEVVKFDMSLIRGVHENENKRKLIRSMTALFDELGLTVIAEGVEIAAERDTLAEMGCKLHQGYLFAKPGRPFPTSSW